MKQLPPKSTSKKQWALTWPHPLVLLSVAALGLVGIGLWGMYSVYAASATVGGLLWFDLTLGSLRK